MTQNQILLLVFIVVGLTSLVYFLVYFFKNPFVFPYMYIDFDVTSKKQPDIDDYIDQYLIDYGLIDFENTLEDIEEWKLHCERTISKSIFKNHRRKQYLKILNINGLFVFRLYRMQIRYRQSNYNRTSYRVKKYVSTCQTSFDFIKDRYSLLKNISFECTLNDYNRVQQRKLMTKELRNKIAKRDNYTCQKCGKYMPDFVGLHIDHIKPVSKGGKSIPSNLQVLCSRCNGSKSSHID